MSFVFYASVLGLISR